MKDDPSSTQEGGKLREEDKIYVSAKHFIYRLRLAEGRLQCILTDLHCQLFPVNLESDVCFTWNIVSGIVREIENATYLQPNSSSHSSTETGLGQNPPAQH